MQAFEYLGVLVSVVIGLAMTHLVLGIIRVIHSRASTTVYWVHLLWVFNVLYLLLGFWWFFFAWQSLPEWSRSAFYLFVTYALCLSIAAGLLFPLMEAVGDFQEFFYKHSRWFFGSLSLVYILDVIEVVAKANSGIRAIPSFYFLYAAIMLVGLAMAIFTVNRRFHGVFVVLFFLAGAGYDLVVFSQTV
ncbi:MAG: hypothetical protein GWN13_23790 [Phycisphaerae bacterium]|nr:hypothetical protein [Phycisphaerae bacterium]NIX01206.1 hypothetical protein [Phycisphaerae bacterium]